MVTRSRKNGTSRLNVLVVGYSGTGKTSFIRTLLKAVEQDKRIQSRRDSGHDESLVGPFLEKTTKVSSVSTEIEIEKEKLVLTLIDTPGFYIEYKVDQQLRDIIQYIEHQFDLTLEEETRVKRNPKAIDTRIHCCLYFIDPEKKQLDEYDVRILTRLSKRVNVIPVIGKADYLTKARRNQLKSKLIEEIRSTYKIPVYGVPLGEEIEEEEEEQGEEEEDTEERGENKQSSASSWNRFLKQFNYEQEELEAQRMLDYLYNFPLTAMAYEEDVDNAGKPIKLDGGISLGRDFGWATVDCLNKDHCDFGQLKDTLLVTHRQFLQQDTVEQYYEKYRTEKLLTKRITFLDSQKMLTDIINL